MADERKTIHIVPNFHYDVEYLQTYEIYRDMCLDNIVEAIRLLKNNPEYTFMVEQVILLQEFWDKYPGFRKDLKYLVQDGRFEIACGMYCMPDMNMPSGESMIDQVKMGKQWIMDKFGVDVKVCWIADCFGQHPQLPQLVKECGYEYYFFSRGATEKEQGDFIWKGIDGSELVTHRGPKAYSTLILRQGDVINAADLIVARVDGKQAVVNAVKPVEPHSASPDILCCNGGDFMRPQGNLIPIVKEWQDENYDCKFSTPLKYFESIKAYKDKFPVYKEDFNPVNMGVYSSRIKIKQNNRQMENLLMAFERMKLLYKLGKNKESCSPVIEKLDYAYEEAKRLTLYNQFHDIICGTILDQAYLDTMHRYKYSTDLIKKSINGIFDIIADVKQEDNKYIHVFNPSSYKRQEAIEISIDILDNKNLSAVIYDNLNSEIPVQSKIDLDKRCINILFYAEVEGLKISSYKLQLTDIPQDKESNVKEELINNPFEFTNKYYTIRIEKNGVITSLKNQAGKELVDIKRPCFNDLLIQADNGDLWTYNESPHNGGYFGRPVKEFPFLDKPNEFLNECYGHSAFSNGEVKLIENGPVRYTVEVKGILRFWRISCEYTQYIYMYKHSPRIDFRTAMKCHGKNYRIRACFPTAIKNGMIEHEIPFGFCERREEEYAAMNWVSYRDDEKGLLLLNKGLPGNNVHNGVMMVSLMRSAAMDYKAVTDLAYEDGEEFDFEYSIVPYDGNLKGIKPWRLGEDINLKCVSRLYDGICSTHLNSLLGINKDNIMLSRIYDENNNLIIRLYEASGEQTECEIEFGRKYSKYVETDCILNPKYQEQEIKEDRILLKFKAFEIKTLVIKK